MLRLNKPASKNQQRLTRSRGPSSKPLNAKLDSAQSSATMAQETRNAIYEYENRANREQYQPKGLQSKASITSSQYPNPPLSYVETGPTLSNQRRESRETSAALGGKRTPAGSVRVQTANKIKVRALAGGGHAASVLTQIENLGSIKKNESQKDFGQGDHRGQ